MGQNNRQDTSVAMRKTVGILGGPPDDLWYWSSGASLGLPLVNAELGEQRLSAAGVGRAVPGRHLLLRLWDRGDPVELLPVFAGRLAIILPMTGVVPFVMALVVLSYREVVSVHVRPGGSYVVARDNFGPRIAQVAAVALPATTSSRWRYRPPPTRPRRCRRCHCGRIRWRSPSVVSCCSSATCGIREAGRAFAVPTYLFSAVDLDDRRGPARHSATSPPTTRMPCPAPTRSGPAPAA